MSRPSMRLLGTHVDANRPFFAPVGSHKLSVDSQIASGGLSISSLGVHLPGRSFASCW